MSAGTRRAPPPGRAAVEHRVHDGSL